MTQSDSIRDKWLKQIAILRNEIATLPEGAARDAALRRAQQLENATLMESWINPLRKSEA